MEAAREPSNPSPPDELDAALTRLDAALVRALDDRSQQPGQLNSFRGLYLSEKDIREELAIPTAQAKSTPVENRGFVVPESRDSPFGWLARAFHLTNIDLDILLIALAPEVDLRYERAYAYLNDDLTRKYPTADLALNLLSCSSRHKRTMRHRFLPDSPLRRFGLIRCLDDPNGRFPSLLTKQLRVDPQVLHLVFGEVCLDDRIRSFCDLVRPEDTGSLFPHPSEDRVLRKLSEGTSEKRKTLKVNLYGPDADSAKVMAAGLASKLDMYLLNADLRAVPLDEVALLLPTLFREAWFNDAVLLIGGLANTSIDYGFARDLKRELEKDGGITIIESGVNDLPWSLEIDDLHRLELSLPDKHSCRSIWHYELEAVGFEVVETELDTLADAYRLSSGEIRHIAKVVSTQAIDCSNVNVTSLVEKSAQTLVNSKLRSLTIEVEPRYTWDDIVLSEATRYALKRICDRVRYRHKVMEEWGFGGNVSLGKGTNVLFTGPSGTGKTMAAEVIAKDLSMPLFRIDLATVVSKYIGETEKNLREIFHAAERARAILLFDEADALFGKRSDVKDSHDRYANIEISYLLQMMEQYEGVSILATNLRGSLDDSFLRRLVLVVQFSIPNDRQRYDIWRNIWPATAPYEAGPRQAALNALPITGGNVKNMAITAAYLAAANGEIVSDSHIEESFTNEMAKMGKKPAKTGHTAEDSR